MLEKWFEVPFDDPETKKTIQSNKLFDRDYLVDLRAFMEFETMIYCLTYKNHEGQELFVDLGVFADNNYISVLGFLYFSKQANESGSVEDQHNKRRQIIKRRKSDCLSK